MNRIAFIGLAVLLFLPGGCLLTGGCASLSRSERAAVEALTLRADSVSRSPSALLEALAEVRLERGLLYAASLSTPEARMKELDGLADGARKDEVDARQAEAYVSVLNGYLRALKSLASDSRSQTFESRIRTLGRRADKALEAFDALDNGLAPLSNDYTTLMGKVLAELGGAAMRNHQGRLVRKMVVEADTLVAATCDSLISILRSDEMNSLIDNEREGLRDNFLTLLHRRAEEGAGRITTEGMDSDRLYIRLSIRIKEAGEIRNRCVSALRSLKNAHSKLATALTDGSLKGADLPTDLWTALDDLSTLSQYILEAL